METDRVKAMETDEDEAIQRKHTEQEKRCPLSGNLAVYKAERQRSIWSYVGSGMEDCSRFKETETFSLAKWKELKETEQ